MNAQKTARIALIRKRIKEGESNDILIEKFGHDRGYFNKMRNKIGKEDKAIAELEKFNGTFSTYNTAFIG